MLSRPPIEPFGLLAALWRASRSRRRQVRSRTWVPFAEHEGVPLVPDNPPWVKRPVSLQLPFFGFPKYLSKCLRQLVPGRKLSPWAKHRTRRQSLNTLAWCYHSERIIPERCRAWVWDGWSYPHNLSNSLGHDECLEYQAVVVYILSCILLMSFGLPPVFGHQKSKLNLSHCFHTTSSCLLQNERNAGIYLRSHAENITITSIASITRITAYAHFILVRCTFFYRVGD